MAKTSFAWFEFQINIFCSNVVSSSSLRVDICLGVITTITITKSFCYVLLNVLFRPVCWQSAHHFNSRSRYDATRVPFALVADDKICYVCEVNNAKACKGWALSIWISVSLKKNTLPECVQYIVEFSLVFAWFWQISSLWFRQHIRTNAIQAVRDVCLICPNISLWQWVGTLEILSVEKLYKAWTYSKQSYVKYKS